MTDDELRSWAKKIFEENLVEGYSSDFKQKYCYMMPSKYRYRYQFFWDTCFHVYSMTALGMTDLAMKSMRSLFAMQEEDGFVGHIIFWKAYFPKRITDIFQRKPSWEFLFRPRMSALIQPPLAAQAVERIYEENHDKQFLKEMLPKLKKYYQWIADNRDFEKQGLISQITYFESGMDWKPSYDKVLGLPEHRANIINFFKVIAIDVRNFFNNYNLKKIYNKNYFIVKDASLNTIYFQNLVALSHLCEIMEDSDASIFKQRAEQTKKSILEVMYDDEDAAFYDVYGTENKKLKVLTPTIFFPIVIEHLDEKVWRRIIEKHLLNKEEFATKFPIPSLAVNHTAFNPDESIFIWRGPTWIVYNWFLHKYLNKHGFKDEATLLVESMKKLIIKSGFREYYNPFTGEGYGAKDFTWGTLIVDMMRTEKK